MTPAELIHKQTGDILYYKQANLVSGLYKIFVPKGTRLWRSSIVSYLSDEPTTAVASFDKPPEILNSEPCGPDTRRTLERLWKGATLSFYSPGGSGGLPISTPESTDPFIADRDRIIYLQYSFPGGKALDINSQLVLASGTTAPAPTPTPTPTPAPTPAPSTPSPKLKTLMIGDSVLYGFLGNSRLQNYPQLVLNNAQSSFDFCYDLSTPGASFGGVLSTDPAVRTANGLPNGKTLLQVLQESDAVAVLINLGGNDGPNYTNVPSYVKQVANTCIQAGKAFAFVGVIDVNASSSFSYSPINTDLYSSGYLPVLANIAASAEMLRQTCIHEGYPFVDIRNLVQVTNWRNITGDVIHPTQEYSAAIFTKVAQAITGT